MELGGWVAFSSSVNDDGSVRDGGESGRARGGAVAAWALSWIKAAKRNTLNVFISERYENVEMSVETVKKKNHVRRLESTFVPFRRMETRFAFQRIPFLRRTDCASIFLQRRRLVAKTTGASRGPGFEKSDILTTVGSMYQKDEHLTELATRCEQNSSNRKNVFRTEKVEIMTGGASGPNESIGF